MFERITTDREDTLPKLLDVIMCPFQDLLR